MQSGNPSHLRAAVRLAVAGVRRRGAPGPPAGPEPGRKPAVERQGIAPSPARVHRYLAATGGEGLYRLDGEDAVMPPTYSAVWETALTLELLALDGMPFPSAGVVHLGSEVVVLRPVRLGDRLRCRLELARVEAHARGVVMVLEFRCWTAAGQLCQQNEARVLIVGAERSRRMPRPARAESERAAEEDEEAQWREVATWKLRGDAGLRYARASGDFNPVHLWPWSARLLGFSRPILHGHCILAMLAHELVRATGEGTRKVSARFRAPVELPAKVRLEAAGGRVRLTEGERRLVEGTWLGGHEPAG